MRLENSQQALCINKMSGERFKSKKLLINYATRRTQETTAKDATMHKLLSQEIAQRYNKVILLLPSKFL